MRFIISLALFLPLAGFSQNNPLGIFDNLVGKTWKAEGNWGDGRKFQQSISFEYSLDAAIVIAKTNGFVDQDQKEFGPRSHGIRQYDPESGSIKFWEFDVFGGLTEGRVVSEGRNILYHYNYGGMQLTDMWEYVDDSTYNFTVGVYADGKWKQRFLKAKFTVK